MRAALVAVWMSVAGQAGAEAIVVQSTTSTKNSGLYDHILPAFKEATGITGACGGRGHRAGHSERG